MLVEEQRDKLRVQLIMVASIADLRVTIDVERDTLYYNCISTISCPPSIYRTSKYSEFSLSVEIDGSDLNFIAGGRDYM